MEWLRDYLESAPQPPYNASKAWILEPDTWIVLSENSSLSRSMVFQPPRRQAVLVYGTLLTACSLLVNLLLAVLLLRRPRADPVYPLRALVLNLSTAHVLLAGLVVPLAAKAEHAGAWTVGPTVCRGWLLAQVLLVALSLYTLLMLTLDRLAYVLSPLAYSRRMDRTKAGLLVAAAWLPALLALTPMLLPLLNDPDYVLEEVCAVSMDGPHAFSLALAAYFAPAGLIVLATLALLAATLSAKRQQARLRTDGPSSPVTASSHARRCCCCCPDVTYATYAEYHDVGSVSVSLSVVNVAQLLAWGPIYVTNLLIPACHSNMCVDPTLWSLFLWLGYTSVVVTPALWFLDRHVRRQAKAMVRCQPSSKAATTDSWYFVSTDQGKDGNRL